MKWNLDDLKQFAKKYLLVPRRYKSINHFLSWYFGKGDNALVVQVGANDGVQSDPLRQFLLNPGNYAAILIEPIPFYVSKLKALYSNRPDVKIIEAACGEVSQTKSLYFIDPVIADEMNGDGPFNNWAHGQGSIDYNTVVHWIEENRFRGEKYSQNVPLYISSIRAVDLSIKRLEEFIPPHSSYLLVIDVQGFELEVLKGVNWALNAPAHILLEDDLGKTGEIMAFLNQKGYRYICGDNDKVFSRAEI